MEIIYNSTKISDELKERFNELLPAWYIEVQELLPLLPDRFTVEFNDMWIIDTTGTGGYATAIDHIELSFNPGFEGNLEDRLHNLKGSYFHECYHAVQGFVGDVDTSTLPAIDNAILEGAATRFESIRLNTSPRWGQYPERKIIEQWFRDVINLPLGYDQTKWQFYDEETGNRWILYRVGVFIIDEVLTNNTDLSIEDLVSRKPSEILKLSLIGMVIESY